MPKKMMIKTKMAMIKRNVIVNLNRKGLVLE